jgi:nucleotide-binding universal stress UspA family protein
MFQNCLICTDFSDGLTRLTNFVPSLVKSGLKHIVFFHSVPLWEEGEVPRVDAERINQAKERLLGSLTTVPPGVEVNVEVVSGKPLDTISRILDNYQIDVIILGTPIRTLLETTIFGSTSMELVRLTSVPLTILRPQLISTYTNEELDLRCQHLWRYLLIPYNDSEAAHYLIQKIKEHARHRGQNSLQECLLIWAIDDASRDRELAPYRVQEAKEKLELVKADLEDLGIRVNLEVRQGNPLQEVLDAACTYNISAIAIASDTKSNLLEWTLSSYAEELLRRSWFPVLFFSCKR